MFSNPSGIKKPAAKEDSRRVFLTLGGDMKLFLQRFYKNYAEGVTAGAGVVGAAPMPPIPLPPCPVPPCT